MKEIFEHIVRHKKWKKSTCGPGSTIGYTQNIREKLKPLLIKHNIKSMFDAPCGDYSWMSMINVQEVVNYSGGDIVEFMIEDNKKNYPTVNFKVFDLTVDSIPDVDLLFCRDLLLHLSFSDIDQVFSNISRSNVKFILTSNWFEDATNTRDIETGGWRYLNFLESPYNFGSPIDSIIDFVDGYPTREMFLWPKDVIDTYIKNISHGTHNVV